VTFLPMSMPMGSHPNLDLLRRGLLIARKRPSNSVEHDI